MLRAPSNQREYDEYWSGDPAFEQLADDATDEQRKAHIHKLKVARETGNWSALVIPGAQPTKFVVRPVPGAVLRRLIDRWTSGAIGGAEMCSLLFRAAIVSIENLGFEHKIERVRDEAYGQLASTKTTDLLDEISVSIVSELGNAIRKRAEGVSPS